MPVGLSSNGSPLPIEFKSVEYPSDSLPCQQLCGWQTLSTSAAYLPNDPQPISVQTQQTNTGRIELNDASD